jgi:putative NADPH-quinone reductase
MRILLIVCHPNKESFNHAIARRAAETLTANSHQVSVRDLYEEKFDPVIPYSEVTGDTVDEHVKEHIEELTKADGIVIVHPNWWGKPPAMLSGWIDRVMRMNAAYTFPKGEEGGAPIGLLKIQKALIFNTANTTPEREQTVFGDPLELIWKNCVHDFCGVKQVVRRTFTVVVDSTADDRIKWLREVETITRDNFPE